MLHAQMRWPAVADESLWPQALQYAVYLHNIMPTEETGVLWKFGQEPRAIIVIYCMLTHGEVQHMCSVPD